MMMAEDSLRHRHSPHAPSPHTQQSPPTSPSMKSSHLPLTTRRQPLNPYHALPRSHCWRKWLQRGTLSILILRFGYYVLWTHSYMSNIFEGGGGQRALDMPYYLKDSIRKQREELNARVNFDVQLKRRANERLERTRPKTSSYELLKLSLMDPLDPWGNLYSAKKIPLSSSSDYNYADLCKSAQIRPESRVLITNTLSCTSAFSLALFLAKQCKVANVYGVDLMFPNLRRHRMKLLDERYRALKRSIARYTQLMPYSGLLGLRNMYGSLKWAHEAHFSHVIFMDLPETSKPWEGWMDEKKYQAFRTEANLQVLRDVLFVSVFPVQRSTMPKIVYVASKEDSSNSALVAPSWTSTFDNVYGNRPVHHLLLPPIVGPLVTTTNETLPKDAIYVEDAMATILQALVPKKYAHYLSIDKQNYQLSSTQLEQTRMWLLHQESLYDLHVPRKHELPATNTAWKYIDTFGYHQPRFPCSSTCQSVLPCTKSVFDSVRALSQSATSQCTYVVYTVLLDKAVDDLLEPKGYADSDLCRIAFVSGKSKLMEQVARNLKADSGDLRARLQKLNGNIEFRGWTLIWLPDDDSDSLSIADNALLRIDPSGMFASNVKKALYAEEQEFAIPSASALLRILSQLDRPAVGPSLRKERRSGAMGSRWVPAPPESARKTILFVGQPAMESLPKSSWEFAELAGDQYFFPEDQLRFYNEVAALVHSNTMRPEMEIRFAQYIVFPYQWISMSILVHDFTGEESRQLRCAWYNEYLYWGGNRNGEELSFAYVFAKARIDGSVGLTSGEESWVPLTDVNKPMIQDPSAFERQVNARNQEIFIRIMKK